MAWSHGVDGSPCGVAVRWASWRSLSAWLKNFDWAAFGADDGALDDAGADGFVELHAASSRRAPASAVARRRFAVMTFPSQKSSIISQASIFSW